MPKISQPQWVLHTRAVPHAWNELRITLRVSRSAVELACGLALGILSESRECS